MATHAAIARVIVDSPLPQLDRLFDYAVPDSMLGQVVPGIRVRVPLRSAGRIADAFVVEVVAEADYSGVLSELDGVVSEVPVLAPEVWSVARRVADRAAGGANDVLRLAVPKRQVRVEKSWLAAEPAGTGQTGTGETGTGQTGTEPTGTRHTGTWPRPPYPGYAAGVVENAVLDKHKLAVDAVPRVVELADGRWVGDWATTMADAAAHSIENGGSAILVVPDYRDQEQLVAALEAVLPRHLIARVDARQSNPDRYRAHLACLGAAPLAIVGNRSAVYAPAANLGLIAIWDDGDPLHSEPLSPYVHARDAALVRQELQRCALMFLSHARSTEVERLVELGFLDVLSQERSYSPRVVPTAGQAPQDRFAAIARIPSNAWREAKTALEAGPVLVQVARPGYAPRLACRDCGQSARCDRCDGPLGTRTATSVPACGWCAKPAAHWSCGNCGGARFALVGQGSARTADELGRAFPGVRVIVADGDHPVLGVGPEPALVVATRGAEPIADGGYRAVLLLDGERMLARESLRVGEDCLRWWSNAAALAANGAPVVLVGVGGALASAMATWQPASYSAAELVDRRRLRFPPAVRVATVTGQAATVEKAIASLSAMDGVDILGPVEVESGGVRAIVRFDYAKGVAVASALRAEIVTAATTRRKRVPSTGARATLPTLRVRFDDTEPFVE